MHALSEDLRANSYIYADVSIQSTGQGLFFDGDRVNNHGIVTLDLITFTTSRALICATVAANCIESCSGSWFDPNGTMITTKTWKPMYQFRGILYTVLHREVHPFGNSRDTAVEGLYYCDFAGSVQSRFYVGLYIEKGKYMSLL